MFSLYEFRDEILLTNCKTEAQAKAFLKEKSQEVLEKWIDSDFPERIYIGDFETIEEARNKTYASGSITGGLFCQILDLKGYDITINNYDEYGDIIDSDTVETGYPQISEIV